MNSVMIPPQVHLRSGYFSQGIGLNPNAASSVSDHVFIANTYLISEVARLYLKQDVLPIIT